MTNRSEDQNTADLAAMPGWRVLARVALIVLVPALLIYLIKLLLIYMEVL